MYPLLLFVTTNDVIIGIFLLDYSIHMATGPINKILIMGIFRIELPSRYTDLIILNTYHWNSYKRAFDSETKEVCCSICVFMQL